MRYRIFTEIPHADFDAAKMAHNARLFFRSKLHVLEREPRRLVVRLEGDFAEPPVELTLVGREVRGQDKKDVTDAERRGNAAGMGALASHCRLLWEIAVPDDAPLAAVLALCAAAASVALGPILPPDGSTLFGVREAIERAERARG